MPPRLARVTATTSRRGKRPLGPAAVYWRRALPPGNTLSWGKPTYDVTGKRGSGGETAGKGQWIARKGVRFAIQACRDKKE